MKKTTTTLLGLSLLVVILTSGIESSKSVSSNNGITGRTTSGCTCHGSQTGTVTLTGLASTVLPSTLYTFNLVFTPNISNKYWGLDIKASNGTLAAGTGMKKSGSEVTHSAPFSSAGTASTTTYTIPGIKWTSPATIGATTFNFACVAGTSTTTTSGPWQLGNFTTTVVLPVEFLSFNVIPLNYNKINITWKTASEINTDHFEVEKSIDGRIFNLFGKVSASGNSQVVNSYSITDLNNSKVDFVYYRIKSIDKDGRSQYSNVQTFSTKNNSTYVNNVYPNPAKVGQDIDIDITSDKEQMANVVLINSQGKIVSSKEKNMLQGFNKLNFKLSNFISAGNYYILVKVGNEISKQTAVSVVE